jgi:hypothetical protein
MKGSEILLGQRIRIYHDRDGASRHMYAVAFMDHKFEDGQYEALLMDHQPLDPQGFCAWGQRREAYQQGKRMRCWELPTQCQIVLLKTLIKGDLLKWFLDRIENLRFGAGVLFDPALPFTPPPWFLTDEMLRAHKDAEITVRGVLALPTCLPLSAETAFSRGEGAK